MRWIATGVAALAFLALIIMVGIIGAIVGQPTMAVGFGPSANARAEIPPAYLSLCMDTGEKTKVDWAILCAIASVESGFGQNNGPSTAGAMGPCQFLPGTWAMPGVGKGGDIMDPADCIPAMARYLVMGGAPEDMHAAILSYNHSEAYVARVMAEAEVYRGALDEMPAALSGTIRERILQIAESTLTKHTGYFRYNECCGPPMTDPTPDPPARTDCSQWVRAIYLAAGVPDPGVNTWDQINHGHMTTNPKPGDLMFAADGGHVEIYRGGDLTWGHGSEAIDEGHVSWYPGAYFEEFPGVE